ncbi:MAG TPA: hypothetical protein VHE55_12660 [Fimbriimonadaceae bacterium]|nr:hypothetical protein [Fimbriimonadaceae bacterium]
MKWLALAAMAAAGACYAQKPPELGPPTAVDIRVQSVKWAPGGDALLYSRTEGKGVGLGLFVNGDDEGKVVLHLGHDDDWTAYWFYGETNALVTVQRQVTTTQGRKKEVAIYLLEGSRKDSSQVYSQFFDPGAQISVVPELSPSLTHAIVTIQDGKTAFYGVLPISGGKLIDSRDIAEAVAEHYSGPTWSKNGTAIFSKGDDSRVAGESKPILRNSTITLEDSQAHKLAAEQALLFSLRGTSLPATGTPVLEVVPTNGVLRQVLSPGPWDEVRRQKRTDTWLFHPMRLELGHSSGTSKSLWIISGSQENAPGTLVAANADNAEIAPDEKAIDYTIDGALFVRQIKPHP